MLNVGDTVKWMLPLDHDYYYGVIINIKKCFATIRGIGLYRHTTADVHFKYITKVAGGRKYGSGKRNY